MSGIESGAIVPNGTVYVFERAVTPSHRQQNPYIDQLCDAWLVFVRQLECHPDVAFLTLSLPPVLHHAQAQVSVVSRLRHCIRVR